MIISHTTNRGDRVKKLLKVLMGLTLVGLVSLFLFYFVATITPLKLDSKQERFTIYDINGSVIYETNFKKAMSWTPIEEIPDSIQEAIISVEDKRFYKHQGFDAIRILQAVLSNIRAGGIVEGGSTITQQMAKNLFLSNDQTFKRKFEELFYAARLEMQYDKKDILEGYLNTLYYGHGIYGIKEAAQYFFSSELNELSHAEIAMLVGIPNGPAIYSPFINPELANQRKNLMLQVMEKNGLISEDEMIQAHDEELIYNTNHDDLNLDAYYIQAVIDQVNVMVKNKEINLSEGGNIYTYYDPNVQAKLSQSFKESTDLSDELESSGLIVEPFSGNILAIQGGKDYTLSQYNRSLYASRQVASTIKPLLYYAALESGFTPSTTFLSVPTTFKIDEENDYSPTNYDEVYPNREISMINAIAMSDNIYAVKTHLFLGSETLYRELISFGINQAMNLPSTALGTVDMSLLELSKIYNTFASCGLFIEPSLISSITNSHQNTLYERDLTSHRLMNLDNTLILNQLLTSTFDLKNRTTNFPTMYGSEPKIQVGAKSGTSNSDSLVIGFNPDYTIAIWSGFDDNRALDKKYYNVSKQIFQQTFNHLYEDATTSSWYSMSNNLEERIVDPISGVESLLGSPYWYLKE